MNPILKFTLLMGRIIYCFSTTRPLPYFAAKSTNNPHCTWTIIIWRYLVRIGIHSVGSCLRVFVQLRKVYNLIISCWIKVGCSMCLCVENYSMANYIVRLINEELFKIHLSGSRKVLFISSTISVHHHHHHHYRNLIDLLSSLPQPDYSATTPEM